MTSHQTLQLRGRQLDGGRGCAQKSGAGGRAVVSRQREGGTFQGRLQLVERRAGCHPKSIAR